MGTEQASQRIRQALYNQLEMRYVPKDEILVKIDTMPQHVWVILEGTVEASSRFCP
jgi:signal-transduction protein with cAMP-binding, CBS, and nucleotidyltransferase domain